MRTTTCRHYNMVGLPDHCLAGVSYLDVARPLTADEEREGIAAGCGDLPRRGLFSRLPCRKENGVDTCPRRSFPSAEEEAEAERRQKEFAVHTLTALALCQKQEAVNGTIPCPRCGGELRYKERGWIGKCATDDCLTWIC